LLQAASPFSGFAQDKSGLTPVKPPLDRRRMIGAMSVNQQEQVPVQEFLSPSRFIDSNARDVVAFAETNSAGAANPMDRVLRLYRAVRDGILYDPYVDLADPANYRASSVLASGHGFCIGKAALLAACARAIGVPARVGYADVRNHLTSPRLYERIKTDLFTWHSYADIHLDGRWVKATPAFNQSLCDRLALKALEFDGRTDSLLHPFDRSGRRHMEYLNDRGSFADVPFETIQDDFRQRYAALMTSRGLAGDFQAEAVAE
jgi:transglutaminase-like putative cysteine protease